MAGRRARHEIRRSERGCMNRAPELTICVASAIEARRAAAAAAAVSAPLTLLSPPGAAAYGGCGWFAAVARQAAADLPADWPLFWVLDCADQAGDALEALAEGARRVVFLGPAEAARRLEAVAAARGAVVLSGRPDALILRAGGDPVAASRAWLAERWTSGGG